MGKEKQTTASFDNVRLFDLVRYMRAELHDEGLITDSEYVAIEMEKGSVKRLEDYDNAQSELSALRKELEGAIRERDACHECWDNFRETVSEVIPDMENAPLFQQGETIVKEISSLRSQLEKAREVLGAVTSTNIQYSRLETDYTYVRIDDLFKAKEFLDGKNFANLESSKSGEAP
jgi:hypothetical protein